ncbi:MULTISPECIES: 2-succinyl-5-enolpyruvyl-6-hydroxy-3-cyclohexene-1-carboxylic-acid synthase [Exiguobacterium]|uniref:2-succinyl-5-enolpyruvyl-6-hydroxy-3- cyclohexene-1-carboxylic-acid synthase n=1 Tax=Exiguobacterium TaxID=33986 RepID=UPI001BE76769|nr:MULTISPECIES: 2-succinyl-5-enolpyruvyl-6-hydroxy-3-cyclohexene-1-carboxylic-acid synthase [Exiguobacterium]MCT4782423.1 2-succinyl-5-enolpyruvyl-6-hydroxy-3-cyclohexene-1-carboxylic-acid synthase [Exiguobacterium himgiriensis]
MNDTLTKWVAHMVNRLVEQGVKDVVISPGSRSTPLAMASYLHPEIRHHIIVDERSAAYFALGLTRSSETIRPVALVCTSGTAATNYFSAIAEATIAQLPLVVLTTDRPHELRNVGAPQAIDQVRLYGEHVKASVDLPVPDESSLSYMGQTISRFVRLAASAPLGPVHVNVPFREPLLPDIEQLKTLFTSTYELNEPTYFRPTPQDVSRFNTCLHVERLAFLVGPGTPLDWLPAIQETAATHRIPIFADPLSGMRRFEDVCVNYDTWLASEHRDEWLPDTIIRFGAAPVSKRLNQWLGRTTQVIIEQPGSFRDPSSTAILVYGDARDYLREINNMYDDAYRARLSALERTTEAAKGGLTGESALTRQLLNTSIERLFVSNSMPIRDVDTTLRAGQPLDVLANRGANGIDGILSSALGACYDTERAALLVGDLAFYHDSNALQLLKTHPGTFSVVIVNNNGGGIFSFLPQASIEPQLFEDLFGTPLELNIRGFADTYGLSYRLVEEPEAIQEAIEAGIHLIEFPSDRAENVRAHREWTSSLCDRLTLENGT